MTSAAILNNKIMESGSLKLLGSFIVTFITRNSRGLIIGTIYTTINHKLEQLIPNFVNPD
jgi:hypothetical protein